MHALVLRNRLVAPLVLVLVAASMIVAFNSSDSAASGADRSAAAAAAPASSRELVARSEQGRMLSRVVGTTGAGQTVSGAFTPLRFSTRNGNLRVRGLLQGVVQRPGQPNLKFAAVRTMRVQRVNGVPAGGSARSVAAAASCDVLRLRLGPLDLNLLGLQVNLNRVILNIVAQTGANALLGNLLCAVTGLLDGGLGGLLGRVGRLLNRILGNLGLGV